MGVDTISIKVLLKVLLSMCMKKSKHKFLSLTLSLSLSIHTGYSLTFDRAVPRPLDCKLELELFLLPLLLLVGLETPPLLTIPVMATDPRCIGRGIIDGRLGGS